MNKMESFRDLAKDIFSYLDNIGKNDSECKTCLILRGVSGSGKSEFALIASKLYKEKFEDHEISICCNDDYFVDEKGNYNFDKLYLEDSHISCYKKFIESVENRTNLIIIDNINASHFDFAPYCMHAYYHNYCVIIVTIKEDLDLCAERTIHNASIGLIDHMSHKINNGSKNIPWKFMNIILEDNIKLKP